MLSLSNAHFLLEWMRRDFRIRYTQTTLGALWAVLQPLTLTLLFVVVFRHVASVKTSVPYASFVLPGMLAWSMFSTGLTSGVNALSGSMYIASKVSYPRIVAPLSAALLPLVDLLGGAPVLVVVLLVQHTRAHLSPVPLVLGLIGCLMLSAGLGSLLGALSMFVRDLRNLVPLLMQVLLLITAVAFPRTLLPRALTWNPLGVLIEAVRSSIVDVPAPSAGALAASLALSALVLAVGLSYVERVQARFTDVA